MSCEVLTEDLALWYLNMESLTWENYGALMERIMPIWKNKNLYSQPFNAIRTAILPP